jgi:hypothetical protein
MKLSLVHVMKAGGGAEDYLHSFLTSTLDASEWSVLHLGKVSLVNTKWGTDWALNQSGHYREE